jgi:serine/threonine protein kinase
MYIVFSNTYSLVEMYDPNATPDAKVDIWALGCILFETLTLNMEFVTSGGMVVMLMKNKDYLKQVNDRSLEFILKSMLTIEYPF